MNAALRRVVAALLGLLAVICGAHVLWVTYAAHGGPMPAHLRESVLAFQASLPISYRYLAALLFIALPIAYVVLWWRGFRSDRLIPITPGIFVQESAISRFLQDVVGAVSEVKSIRARARMLRGKGLEINCLVTVETRTQLSDIESRLRSAVRGVMAERLAMVPVSEILITVKSLEADRATKDLAAKGSAPPHPLTPSPVKGEGAEVSSVPPGPSDVPPRATIDLSPIEPDSEEETVSEQPPSPRPFPREGGRE